MKSRYWMMAVLASAPVWGQRPPEPPAPPQMPQVWVMGMPGGSFLGVNVAEVDSARAKELKLSEERGVEVTGIDTDSPAERAGIRKGDVVLEFAGERVLGMEQFARMVRETPAGRAVKISIWRNGAAETVTAAIGKRKARQGTQFSQEPGRNRMEMPQVWIPDMPNVFSTWRSSMLGVEAEALSGQFAQFFGVNEGVLVRSVMRGSAAEKAGLKAGDVIVRVDRKDVSNPRSLSSELRSRQKKTLPLAVVRERKEMTVSVTMEDEDGDLPAGRAVTRREDQ